MKLIVKMDLDKKTTALAYMQEFACLGSDCEDSCCRHWDVNFDKATYRRIKTAMSQSKAERNESYDNIKKIKDGSKTNYATFTKSSNGDCIFLNHEHQCSLHIRYGAEVLSRQCSSFPRRLVEFHDRFEMTGSLSCPEIVRKSLLSDQLNFTPFATEQLAEHQVLPLTLPWINASIDEVSLDSIRNAACSHLSRHNIPLIERLLHVRNFCTKIDRASKNEQVSLAEELLTLTTELKITALESSSKEKSAELRLNGIDAMTVVCHSLLQLLNAGAHPPLQKVITQAFASYSGVPGQEIEVDSTPQPSITIAQAQTAYLERSVTYGKVIGDQLDKILAQYAIHYWLSEPCVSSPKLLQYFYRLMIHLVLQRILLLGQPRLQMAVEEMETNPQENERKVAETLALDATRVFYSFARSVEHNDACSTLLYDAWFKTPTQGILEQLVPIFATGSTP